MKPFLFALGVIMSMHVNSQQIAKNITTSKNILIGFYQYTPTDYSSNPSKKYPLIIFLHGLGERGNGTTDLPRVTTHGIPKEIKNGHPMRFYWNGKWESFIVLSPQLSSSYTVWQTFYVDEMLAYANKNLRIDANRIAVTGMSLGGGGTWSFASRTHANAQSLSSLVVVCGTYKVSDMSTISNAKLPVWALHATDDGSVSVNNTHTAISLIEAQNPSVKPYKTIWPTGNHGIWTRAYDTGHTWQNPNIYEWMIAQDKSLPVNIRPSAHAGSDLTVSSGTPVTLSGTLSKDEDGSIVRYIWRKVSGPSTCTIKTPVSEDGATQVTGMGSGIYSFELKAVDDRADYTLDTVVVNVVNYSTPNIPPVVNAGDDKIIYATRTELLGTNSYDPDGTIVSYKWTLDEGPGQYTILDENAGNTEVINLGSGTYKFKLTATDNRGATRTGIVTITEMSTVLDVDFGTITVNRISNSNIVKWNTLREIRNDYFEIQRSDDGITFMSIDKLKGKDFSRHTVNYSYEDKNVKSEIQHYRIKQVSKNKKVSYSAIVKTSPIKTEAEISVYPVPARESVTMQFKTSYSGQVQIKIMSLNGQILYSRRQPVHRNSRTITVPIHNLNPGIYLTEARMENGMILTQKIIKQ